MLTILEAIQLSTDYLEKKGIESPRSNAELLLADILKCTRLNLYLSFDKPLSDLERLKYRESIQRRGRFEPLQYITGKVEFFGLVFSIQPGVLIPRPETEFLIEIIISKFKDASDLKILDIGCGSGIIPISLFKNLSNPQILAIDKNENALNCAKINAEQHKVTESISFNLIDIFSEEQIDSLGAFDVVVSNPPYVSLAEFDELQKEIVEYEPKEAVTDFNDGLSFYQRIISLSASRLLNKGWLFFEMGLGQSNSIKQLLLNSGFSDIEIVKDLQGIDRVICGRKL